MALLVVVGYGAAVAISLCVLVLDSLRSLRRLQSLGGLFILIFCGYIASYDRDKIPWKVVANLVAFLLATAALVLRWNLGHVMLNCVSRKVASFLEIPSEASQFMFGYLSAGLNLSDYIGEAGQNVTGIEPAFIFGVRSMSVMFYVSFFVNVFYFHGLLQSAIVRIAAMLRLVTGATPIESISCVANCFVGMVEAPLMISPYLPALTKAELHCIMSSGFATIAGTIMAAYINFGLEAGHLLLASLMSAPAAVACSKILYPETEQPEYSIGGASPHRGPEKNALEAVSRGGVATLLMMGGVAASSIAFLAFLAIMNQIVAWFLTNTDAPAFTFEDILGVAFTPLALIIGVAWQDCVTVGQLFGIKMFSNEFFAFWRLTKIAPTMEPRSVLVSTYALCGFANFGSLGTTLGGLSVLCPTRMDDITKLVFRALCAGWTASLMTACAAEL
ncbi:solute carrier family 28 member 3-like [Haemaphysalis longicornis]